nr:DeoR family transcriptional regulator [Streptomyces spiramenti]
MRRRGGVRVSELTAELGVSEMTVRRDLDTLERRGALRKVHGGAGPTGLYAEPGFREKAHWVPRRSGASAGSRRRCCRGRARWRSAAGRRCVRWPANWPRRRG